MITPLEIVQIAAKIPASPKTVERVYKGRGSPYSRARVVRAARDLGLPVPAELELGAVSPAAAISHVGAPRAL